MSCRGAGRWIFFNLGLAVPLVPVSMLHEAKLSKNDVTILISLLTRGQMSLFLSMSNYSFGDNNCGLGFINVFILAKNKLQVLVGERMQIPLWINKQAAKLPGGTWLSFDFYIVHLKNSQSSLSSPQLPWVYLWPLSWNSETTCSMCWQARSPLFWLLPSPSSSLTSTLHRTSSSRLPWSCCPSLSTMPVGPRI